MRILIFGANGMLGHKLYQQLGANFHSFGTIRGTFESIAHFPFFERDRIVENINAADSASIEAAIRRVEPNVVINAIGIIKQLPSSHNVISALSINSIFPHRLAEFGEKYGFRLISVSTDCVFDGKRGNYTEDDIPNAEDLYGKSKALGEVTVQNCLTLRTSIIGRELGTSHSLVEWVLSNRGKRIEGFTNAIYSGFPTIVFADIIKSLIVDHKELSGLYQVASSPINKFDLLNLINKYYDAGIEIAPSDDLRIDRSLNAARFNQITGYEPPDWEEMVKKMASDPTPYEAWK
ncbi:MAG: SDR family oxidoreductase [Acidobacteriota bacterium]